MIAGSFTTTHLFDRTPEEVLDAILDVRGWWSSELEGDSRAPGDVFVFRYQDIHYSHIEVTEVSPEVVRWRVLENHLSFVEDQEEWVDTEIVFEIARAGDSTRLTFTHDGLVPSFECYDACHQGWTMYAADSLKSLIETGRGSPAGDGIARTEAERSLSGSR